jgi:Flp pilus assembly protein TadG
MKRARNAGTVAVEFAIIGSVFVSLLLLAMEVGPGLAVIGHARLVATCPTH